MDGRQPVALAYVNSSNDPPEDLQQFCEWYQRVHWRTVQRLTFLTNPTMFVQARSPAPADEGTMLSVYEIYDKNLSAGLAELDRQRNALRAEFDTQLGSRRVFRSIYQIKDVAYGKSRPQPSQTLVVIHMVVQSPVDQQSMKDSWRSLAMENRRSDLFQTMSLGERFVSAFGGQESVAAFGGSDYVIFGESNSIESMATVDRLSSDILNGLIPDSLRISKISVFTRFSPGY